MAYDKSIQAKVRAKYVQGMPLASAAEACKVPYNTARNWKRQATDAGTDWDISRNAQRMSKSGAEDMANEVLGLIAEQFLATLQALENEKKMPADKKADILVRLMDGYNKSISASARAMPNANRLAVAMEVLKFLTQIIGERHAKFRAQFLTIVESVGDDFAREFGSGA